MIRSRTSVARTDQGKMPTPVDSLLSPPGKVGREYVVGGLLYFQGRRALSLPDDVGAVRMLKPATRSIPGTNARVGLNEQIEPREQR